MEKQEIEQIDKRIERNSNIELLRIGATLGVILLHYNNSSFGGGFKYVEPMSVNFFILLIIESLCICAVDLFMLICGYFSCDKKSVNLNKPFHLLLQVVLFSLAWNIAAGAVTNTLTLNRILLSFLPTNYFVILYVTVYMLIPYLNIAYDYMSRTFMALLLLLFSFYPTCVEILKQVTGQELFGLSSIGAYGSQYGYTIVNFLLMYYVGMYCRKFESEMSKRANTIYLLVVVSMISLCAYISILSKYSYNTAWMYCNPFIFLAFLLFRLFSKFNIRNLQIVNRISSASFTVYLIQGYFLRFIKVEKAVSSNPFAMFCHMALTSMAIYAAGVGIHTIYHFLLKKMRNKIIGIDHIITAKKRGDEHDF